MKMKRKMKGLISCSIGNALEWYDFMIYGYFSPTIGKLFFPEFSGEFMNVFLSLLVFAIGFIARPIGAIIFGHIGDKLSRKTSLLLAIYLMMVPTFLIGCLPTYAEVGMTSPILLLSLRLIQGLALGGGFSGSMVFLVEHAKKKHQGFSGSFSTCSLIAGAVIGSAVSAIIFKCYSGQEILEWAWRIPFLLSAISGGMALYLRKNINDSENQKNQDKNFFPMKEILTKNRKELFTVVFLDLLTAVGFFGITIYLPVFLAARGVPELVAQNINTVNMLIFGGLVILGGYTGDKIGFSKTLCLSALTFSAISYPAFYLLNLHKAYTIFFGQLLLILPLGIFFGIIPATIVRIFPEKLRTSGVGLAHNLSMALFGGTTPSFLVWFSSRSSFESPIAVPSITFAVAGILSALASILYYKCYEVKFEK